MHYNSIFLTLKSARNLISLMSILLDIHYLQRQYCTDKLLIELQLQAKEIVGYG